MLKGPKRAYYTVEVLTVSVLDYFEIEHTVFLNLCIGNLFNSFFYSNWTTALSEVCDN